MWHLKTKQGTFWIIEGENSDAQYHLGCDDDHLNTYEAIQDILIDIDTQQTGHQKWDEQLRVFAPESLQAWSSGPPEYW